MHRHGPAALIAGLILIASPVAARGHPSSESVGASKNDSDKGNAARQGPIAAAQQSSADARVSVVDRSSPSPRVDGPAPTDVPSEQARQVINWVRASHDNNEMPFMVIDKGAAEVFLFASTGEQIASARALLGMTVGDESTPGVGDRELSNIPAKDRKTPAGRFVAKFGRAAGGRDVLWVDYPSAISLHPVVTIRNQHRLERLKSPASDDKRITYGCINVPTSFYAKTVKPLFKKTPGIVYILPETKTLHEVFLAMPTEMKAAAATTD